MNKLVKFRGSNIIPKKTIRMKNVILTLFFLLVITDIQAQVFLPNTQGQSGNENLGIGIGTSQPNVKLLVNGNASIFQDLRLGGRLIINRDDPQIVLSDTYDDLDEESYLIMRSIQGKGQLLSGDGMELLSGGGMSFYLDHNNISNPDPETGTDINDVFSILRDDERLIIQPSNLFNYTELGSSTGEIWFVSENNINNLRFGEAHLYGASQLKLLPNDSGAQISSSTKRIKFWDTYDGYNNIHFGKGFLYGGDNVLRLLPNNPGVEIGSSTGEIKFWYSDIGYNTIHSGDFFSNGKVGINTGSVAEANLHVNGSIKLEGLTNNNNLQKVLAISNEGKVFLKEIIAGDGSESGDNLGDHTATTNLNMDNRDIRKVNKITFGGAIPSKYIQSTFEGIEISSRVGINAVPFGDANLNVNGNSVFSGNLSVENQGDLTVSGNAKLTDLEASGSVSASVKNFKIDHPIDPLNKFLFHTSVESPDMMNIYNGNIITDENGLAKVQLPDYFEALNYDFRYQLTVIATFAQAIIKQKVSDNFFIIQTNLPNIEVSWQVTGIRKDKYAMENRVKAVVNKTRKEKGSLIYESKKNK